MKLEVVTLPVSDVDRAKSFYQGLAWRIDADIAFGDNFRVVQLTPLIRLLDRLREGSRLASRLVKRLILAVDDVDAAREDLMRRGVDVSEAVSTSPGAVCRAGTRRAGRTRAMRRSMIRTATGGYSRRSRLGFRAGSGRTDHGRRVPGGAAEGNRRAPRPVREEPRPAQLVGLVRRLHDAREQGSTPDDASEAARATWRTSWACGPLSHGRGAGRCRFTRPGSSSPGRRTASERRWRSGPPFALDREGLARFAGPSAPTRSRCSSPGGGSRSRR